MHSHKKDVKSEENQHPSGSKFQAFQVQEHLILQTVVLHIPGYPAFWRNP